jgi:hypothetical protein
LPWWGRETEHPVCAQPPQEFDREIGKEPGQTGHVVSGIEHDRDRQIPRPPVTGLVQPPDQLTQLLGGDLGLVVVGADPLRVEHRRPGGAARLQRRQDRIRPAGDRLADPVAAAGAVAVQPLCRGLRVRARPR